MLHVFVIAEIFQRYDNCIQHNLQKNVRYKLRRNVYFSREHAWLLHSAHSRLNCIYAIIKADINRRTRDAY